MVRLPGMLAASDEDIYLLHRHRCHCRLAVTTCGRYVSDRLRRRYGHGPCVVEPSGLPGPPCFCVAPFHDEPRPARTSGAQASGEQPLVRAYMTMARPEWKMAHEQRNTRTGTLAEYMPCHKRERAALRLSSPQRQMQADVDFNEILLLVGSSLQAAAYGS